MDHEIIVVTSAKEQFLQKKLLLSIVNEDMEFSKHLAMNKPVCATYLDVVSGNSSQNRLDKTAPFLLLSDWEGNKCDFKRCLFPSVQLGVWSWKNK